MAVKAEENKPTIGFPRAETCGWNGRFQICHLLSKVSTDGLSCSLRSLRALRTVLAAGLLLGLGSVVLASTAQGQELACRVQLDKSQLSGSDYGYLDELPQRIEEYMNARNWTDDEFQSFERIACSIQIIIEDAPSLSTFDARLIVSSRRPIYETAQSTIILRVNDPNWQFEYSRGTSLNFDVDQYNPLTSTLDYYAYMLLGYDYDTFSELGGTPYFEQARTIADRAKGTGDPGWSSVSSQQNRLQLINELLSQRHRPLRRAYYHYHLNGLDQFVNEPARARENILSALESLQEVSRNVSGSYALDLFFSAKYEELAAVFEGGELRDQAYNLLTQVDPSHSSEYNSLVQ